MIFIDMKRTKEFYCSTTVPFEKRQKKKNPETIVQILLVCILRIVYWCQDKVQ